MGMMDHYSEIILKPNPMAMEITKGYMSQLRDTLTPEAYASTFYEAYLKIETTINKCANDALRAEQAADLERMKRNNPVNSSEMLGGFRR